VTVRRQQFEQANGMANVFGRKDDAFRLIFFFVRIHFLEQAPTKQLALLRW
jgi:hypothetical protein